MVMKHGQSKVTKKQKETEKWFFLWNDGTDALNTDIIINKYITKRSSKKFFRTTKTSSNVKKKEDQNFLGMS